MEYGKIIAVTGLPGLFELLSSKNDGAIVRSLEDKTTRFVSSRVHNFSHLESIEVFTVRENVNLIEIFHAMEKEGATVPGAKDGAALKAYFQKVTPELDFERVYTSDLKKMVRWFEILKENNVELKLSQDTAEEEEQEAPAAEETAVTAKKKQPVEEAPAGETKTAEAKKAAGGTAKKTKVAEKEAEPATKAAAKKPAGETKTTETKKAAGEAVKKTKAAEKEAAPAAKAAATKPVGETKTPETKKATGGAAKKTETAAKEKAAGKAAPKQAPRKKS